MNTRIDALTAGPDMPDGKRRLIAAALRLAARHGSVSSVGLRELGREAGLNPNTFYRHFNGVEELTQAAAEELSRHIMAGMGKVRAEAYRHADATEGAARYFLEEVAANPDAFRVGVQALHGNSPHMRRIMQDVIRQIAELSVAQIEERDLVPGLGRSALFEAAMNITYYMLYRALDFLDDPGRAQQVREDIVRFIRVQFMGQMVLDRQKKQSRKQKESY